MGDETGWDEAGLWGEVLLVIHVQHGPLLTGRGVLSFQEYIDAHPETIVLDPLPAIRTLLDRSKSYELIRKIEAYMKGMAAGGAAPRRGPPCGHCRGGRALVCLRTRDGSS